MIIHVDLDPAELKRLDPLRLHRGMREALAAHRSGDHLLVMARGVARTLLETLPFDPSDKATLTEVAQAYTQTGDLLRRTTWLIRVRSDPKAPTEREVQIGIDQLASRAMLRPTELIVEDIVNDEAVYKFILKVCQSKLGIRASFDWTHGAGERISDVVARQVQQGRIVVAIVDTDHSAPSALDCFKVRSIRAAVARSELPFWKVMPFPGRELENVFPLDIVRQARTLSADARVTLNVLATIAHSEKTGGIDPRACFWLYFDMKEGFDESRLERIRDDADRRWVAEKLALAGLRTDNCSLCGLGPGFLSDIVANQQILGEVRRQLLQPDWLAVFGDFVQHVLWAGAANPRQYA